MQHDSQMSLYGLLTFNRYSSPILISNLMPNIFIFVFLLFFLLFSQISQWKKIIT